LLEEPSNTQDSDNLESNVNDNKHLKESAKGFDNQIKEKGLDELLEELYNTKDSDNLEYSLPRHHLEARIIKI
jgi:hypothetical protein